MESGTTIVLSAIGISILVLAGHLWCAITAFKTGYKKGHLGQGTHYGLVFGLFGLQKVESWFQTPHPNLNNNAFMENSTDDPKHLLWHWGLFFDGLGITGSAFLVAATVISRSFDYSPIWLWPIGIAFVFVGGMLLKSAGPPFHILPPLIEMDYGEPLELVNWIDRRWKWAIADKRALSASNLCQMFGWIGGITLLYSLSKFGDGADSGSRFGALILLSGGLVSVVLALFFQKQKTRCQSEKVLIENWDQNVPTDALSEEPSKEPQADYSKENPGKLCDATKEKHEDDIPGKPSRLEIEYYIIQQQMEELLAKNYSRRNDFLVITLLTIALVSLVFPSWVVPVVLGDYTPAIILSILCLIIWIVIYWSYKLRNNQARKEKAEYEALYEQEMELGYLFKEREFIVIKAEVADQPSPVFDFGSSAPLFYERTLIPEAARIIEDYEQSFDELLRKRKAEENDYHSFVSRIKKFQYSRVVFQSLALGLFLGGCNDSILRGQDGFFISMPSLHLLLLSFMSLVFSFALLYPIQYGTIRSAGCWIYTGITCLIFFIAIVVENYLPRFHLYYWILGIGGITQIIAFLYLSAHIAKTRKHLH